MPQPEFTKRVLPQELSSPKSEGLAVILAIFSAELSVFVSVTVWGSSKLINSLTHRGTKTPSGQFVVDRFSGFGFGGPEDCVPALLTIFASARSLELIRR